MKRVLKLILKEIAAIIVATVALLAFFPIWWGWVPIGIIPVGILWTFFKPLYDYRKRPFKVRCVRWVVWIGQVIYQVWNVVKYAILMVGYIIDLLSNVLIGELIEDWVTSEENTLFGKGNITISAALGDLKRQGKLNKHGLWLCRWLSRFDMKHKDHTKSAIELYEFKQNQR